jgi:hypothetical protein
MKQTYSILLFSFFSLFCSFILLGQKETENPSDSTHTVKEKTVKQTAQQKIRAARDKSRVPSKSVQTNTIQQKI